MRGWAVVAGPPRTEEETMTEYLIAFNDDWVPDHTLEELHEKSRALRPLVAECRVTVRRLIR